MKHFLTAGTLLLLWSGGVWADPCPGTLLSGEQIRQKLASHKYTAQSATSAEDWKEELCPLPAVGATADFYKTGVSATDPVDPRKKIGTYTITERPAIRGNPAVGEIAFSYDGAPTIYKFRMTEDSSGTLWFCTPSGTAVPDKIAQVISIGAAIACP